MEMKNEAKKEAEQIERAKQCTRCKVVKPLSDFGKDKKSPDGKSYWCRQCFSEHRIEKQPAAPLRKPDKNKTSEILTKLEAEKAALNQRIAGINNAIEVIRQIGC